MVSFNAIGSYDKADTQIQSIPFNFIRSGRYVYNSGDIYGRNERGTYWPSTAKYIDEANTLFFNFDNLRPWNSGYKGYGWSLRCLVR